MSQKKKQSSSRTLINEKQITSLYSRSLSDKNIKNHFLPKNWKKKQNKKKIEKNKNMAVCLQFQIGYFIL